MTAGTAMGRRRPVAVRSSTRRENGSLLSPTVYLKAGIDRLAFERQDAEHAFVDAAKRLTTE
jgi:hypothetical protein